MLRDPLLAVVLVSGFVACDRSGEPAAAGAATASATVVASAKSVTRAIITMDDAHDLMKSGEKYSITPATELVIEVAGYRFRSADGGTTGPVNAVHVAHGSSEYHRATWAGGARITLNAASLDPVRGGAFSGFSAGEEYLVAVGSEAPSADGVLRFAPAWTTMVSVKPR